MNPTNPFKTAVFILLAVSAVSLVSCGKKGLPVMPGLAPPPGVTDLSYSIDQDMLKLEWTVPEQFHSAKGSWAGFVVYRSRVSLSGEVCQGCPVMFKPVADLPIGTGKPDKRFAGKMVYSEVLEKFCQYVYKVSPRSNGNASGTDSNYVEFKY